MKVLQQSSTLHAEIAVGSADCHSLSALSEVFDVSDTP